ncbi:uncharacterized protein LOC120626022 [Pararge aegeria]|uniref:uncharacterized protein LOC120626022 n=1 Tax=Pararge aegeria TaxID=116150 RepID=UPI0019D189B2|nr:uncharacterized protein LOC120626022 [Pararge aegeria]
MEHQQVKPNRQSGTERYVTVPRDTVRKSITFKRKVTSKELDLKLFDKIETTLDSKSPIESPKMFKTNLQDISSTSIIPTLTTEIHKLQQLYVPNYTYHSLDVDKIDYNADENIFSKNYASTIPVKNDMESLGTVEIEALLDDIKQREIEMLADQEQSVTNLISNAVTETNFVTDSLIKQSSISPGYAFKTFLFVTYPNNHLLSNRLQKRQVCDKVMRIKNEETYAHNIEDKLQKQLKKTYFKVKAKFSKTYNKELEDTKATIQQKIEKYKTKATSCLSFKSTANTKLKTKGISKSTTETKLDNSKCSTSSQTKLTLEDEFTMLSILEQLLAKSHASNVRHNIMLTTPKDYKNKLSKRLSIGNLKSQFIQENSTDKSYNDGEEIPDVVECASIENDTDNMTVTRGITQQDDHAQATAEDVNYQALSNKISYNDYVNGFKYYLNFQKDNDDEKYSNLIRYQAHKHHNVDDIGKFILKKIPHLPTTRFRRYYVESETLEDQDISTKSEDSWFKKHFFLFLDTNPPRKFHTAQTVSLKVPDFQKNISSKGRTNAPPEQYYTTFLPMQIDDFKKFLKENKIDVESVTAPLIISLPRGLGLWNRNKVSSEPKLGGGNLDIKEKNIGNLKKKGFPNPRQNSQSFHSVRSNYQNRKNKLRYGENYDDLSANSRSKSDFFRNEDSEDFGVTTIDAKYRLTRKRQTSSIDHEGAKLLKINSRDYDVNFKPEPKQRSNVLRIRKPKFAKRNAREEIFTAKDVAALEIVVDLMKNTQVYGKDKENFNSFYNNTDHKYVHNSSSLKERHVTNSIQVQIAIPYNTDDRKRSSEPFRLRKVFSAVMSTPVDLEYQIHSFEETTTVRTTILQDILTPGLYLLVENTNITCPEGNFVLKPIKNSKFAVRQVTSTIEKLKSKITTSENVEKASFKKDFMDAVNKVIKFNKNSEINNTNCKTKRSMKTQLERNSNRKNSSNFSEIRRQPESKRNINWDGLKRFFCHDRVYHCYCKANETMCRPCAACDAIISELLFELNNLAYYMSQHCTEIQTYFWMNPSGGKKLRDVIHRIDKTLSDYYRRVKGKCQGRTCPVISSNIDRRSLNRHNKELLLNRLNNLADDLEKSLEYKIFNDNVMAFGMKTQNSKKSKNYTYYMHGSLRNMHNNFINNTVISTATKKSNGLISKIADQFVFKIVSNNKSQKEKPHFCNVTKPEIGKTCLKSKEKNEQGLLEKNTEADDQTRVCDISATIDHVVDMHDIMPNQDFEQYIKSMSCQQYKSIPNYICDEIFAMIGDTVSIDCHQPDYNSNQTVSNYVWSTGRQEILDHENISINGSKVFLKEVGIQNAGTYICTKGHAVIRSTKVTIISIPCINIVFTPVYRIDAACSYKIDDSSYIKPIVVISLNSIPHINCSSECRRNLYCSLARLLVSNMPSLAIIKVLLSFDGMRINKTLSPLIGMKRKTFVTHTLRRKDYNGHREFHNTAHNMDPGNFNLVLLCQAGFYLLSKQKICVVCPSNTFAKEGDNICKICPYGSLAAPGSKSCHLPHLRSRRFSV